MSKLPKLDRGAKAIDFRTDPERYRHWRLKIEPPLAHLVLDVAEDQPLFPGYELKRNSYDLGVDIELSDAVQRLRFEHPEVRCVVIDSAKDRIFCAGANIRMLGGASHHHKVNFCKFTNETRLGIEDAAAHSGQRYLAALSGTAAGGGYEIALATDYILLVDDGSSTVALPEVPLLGVLPGTGGLTRVVDKRKVRRDLADVFCTLEEGVKGKRAVEWGLVDELAPKTRFADTVHERALELAGRSDRPARARGITLPPLERAANGDGLEYPHLRVAFDRTRGVATLTLLAPALPPPVTPAELPQLGADFWPLALARALDDALLHQRFNEPRLGILVFESRGDADLVAQHDNFLAAHQGDWLVREILLYWKRVLKRVDVGSRTVFTLVLPGSCFAGLLAELLFAADRCYMFDGTRAGDPAPAPTIRLSGLNFGLLPMPNGLTRLATRFLGAPERVGALRSLVGQTIDAERAEEAGLVTAILDPVDWDDEVRIAIEERASLSGDSLTGMEANLRFPGPETLETKIFGRLSAWQNWIFQRPNAAGDQGALKRYGTGLRPAYDPERV